MFVNVKFVNYIGKEYFTSNALNMIMLPFTGIQIFDTKIFDTESVELPGTDEKPSTRRNPKFEF